MSENNMYIAVEESNGELIELDKAFPSLGNLNTKLYHNNLNGRDEADQHIITSITGLREELDIIEKLKASLYANQRNYAQYHLWYDGNPLRADGTREDRNGYFVTLVDDTDHIKICNSADEDVFGVVVNEEYAGFAGGKLHKNLDGTDADMSQYGLVLLIGLAKVRCVDNVIVGDCVIPNVLGIAHKTTTNAKISIPHYQIIDITEDTLYSLSYIPQSGTLKAYMVNDDGETLGVNIFIGEEADGRQIGVNGSTVTVVVGDGGYAVGDKICFMYTYDSSDGLGYKVTSIFDEAGVRYATIRLVPNTSMLARIKENVNSLTARVIAVEGGVTAALNRAEEAYLKAENCDGSGHGGGSSGGGSSDDGSGSGDDDNGDDNNPSIDGELEEILDDIKGSIAEIDDIIKYVTYDIDGSILEVETIKDKFEPILEWQDPNSGNKGASYFVDYIDNGLKTTAKIETLENDVKESQTAVLQNAESLRSLATTTRKYSVGDRSPAYGLTLSEAIDVLPVGTIYVPYASNNDNITETYKPNTVFPFTKGYSYKWTSNGWEQETTEENVMFFGEYLPGSAGLRYWFLTGDNDIVVGNITYEKETLYMWNNFNWVSVASLTENSSARVASLVNQKADSITSTVRDMSGNISNISQRVTDQGARIDLIAGAQGDAKALAAIMQKAEKNEASIRYITEYGHEILDYSEITEVPEGTFYASKPTWNALTNTWEFDGDSVSFDMATYEYRYAKADGDAYFEYRCESANKWVRIKIRRANSIAAIQQKVDKNGASIGMLVDNGGVKAGVIVKAINDDSSIKINADKINLEGVTTFVKPGDLESLISATVISGDQITTGSIKSASYVPGTSGSKFSASGTMIDLNSGNIYTPTFAVDGTGAAYFSGTLNSPQGNIGGFSITDNAIRNTNVVHPTYGTQQYMNSYNSLYWTSNMGSAFGTDYGTDNNPKNRDYVYVGTNGIGTCRINKINMIGTIDDTCLSKTYMAAGKIFSNSGEIGGFSITDNAMRNEFRSGGIPQFMRSYYELNATSSMWDTNYGTDADPKNRDYVYVGTDGIGTCRINSINTDGTIDDTCLSKTYMAAGGLFSNYGKIGGFNISSTSLITDKYTMDDVERLSGFRAPKNNNVVSDAALAIGYKNGYAWYTAPFYVTFDGALYATKANISGTITSSGEHKYSSTQQNGFPTYTTIKDGRLKCEIQNTGIYTNYSEFNARGISFWRKGADGSSTLVKDDGLFTIEGYTSALPDSTGIIPYDGYRIKAQQLCLSSTVADGLMEGTWLPEDWSSDERIKNTIEELPELYDVLFDNLIPKRYKYNYGTSNRFHTGYVAQEVVNAIEAAGLTTQDFAGVILHNPNTEQERWYLRRDEFVSLNTWQIQKLKPRVTSLEERVQMLEEENIQLKDQIALLLNNS